MHTAFRALAAQRGSRATFTGFAGWTLDPGLVTQLIVACGDQLIPAGFSLGIPSGRAPATMASSPGPLSFSMPKTPTLSSGRSSIFPRASCH